MTEFRDDKLGPWTAFRAQTRFNPKPAEESGLPANIVLEQDDFRVECTTLDHGTPCLAFALQERLRVSVWREGLDTMGLDVGAWLNRAKSAVRAGAPDEMPIEVGPGRIVALGQLRQHALHVSAGQRIAYVTDAAYHPANTERIIAISRNADHLYIEAAFLDEDAGTAAARCHLTGRQAGELARRAGANRMTVFHHSPRYLNGPEDLWLETCGWKQIVRSKDDTRGRDSPSHSRWTTSLLRGATRSGSALRCGSPSRIQMWCLRAATARVGFIAARSARPFIRTEVIFVFACSLFAAAKHSRTHGQDEKCRGAATMCLR